MGRFITPPRGICNNKFPHPSELRPKHTWTILTAFLCIHNPHFFFANVRAAAVNVVVTLRAAVPCWFTQRICEQEGVCLYWHNNDSHHFSSWAFLLLLKDSQKSFSLMNISWLSLQAPVIHTFFMPYLGKWPCPWEFIFHTWANWQPHLLGFKICLKHHFLHFCHSPFIWLFYICVYFKLHLQRRI